MKAIVLFRDWMNSSRHATVEVEGKNLRGIKMKASRQFNIGATCSMSIVVDYYGTEVEVSKNTGWGWSDNAEGVDIFHEVNSPEYQALVTESDEDTIEDMDATFAELEEIEENTSVEAFYQKMLKVSGVAHSDEVRNVFREHVLYSIHDLKQVIETMEAEGNGNHPLYIFSRTCCDYENVFLDNYDAWHSLIQAEDNAYQAKREQDEQALKEKTMQAELPFGGFYCGLVADEINYQVESHVQWMNEQFGTEIEPYGNIDIYTSIDYQAIAEAYAKKFPVFMESAIDYYPDSMAYDGLYMPQYYNFKSDRIFVTLSAYDLLQIWERVDVPAFEAWLLERMRPRDGFIPHYSNHLSDWGTDVTKWGMPMVGLLFEYIARTHSDRHGESPDFCFYDNDGYKDIYNAIAFRPWDMVVQDYKEWNEEE